MTRDPTIHLAPDFHEETDDGLAAMIGFLLDDLDRYHKRLGYVPLPTKLDWRAVQAERRRRGTP